MRLHDIKSITVGALEYIIKFGREYGYEFSAIDMNTYMVRHGAAGEEAEEFIRKDMED